MSETREPVRLSRVEIVGAWLRLWTPPRGAVVPPVPWRKLALGALGLAVLIGALAAYSIPRIQHSKESRREREQKRLARAQAADRKRLRFEQRALTGSAPRPSGLHGRARLRARATLLTVVEQRITADARRRAARGELQGRAVRTECQPAPSSVERVGAERVLSRRSDIYDCVAVTGDIRSTRAHRGGELGYPFRARVDFRRFAFVWCKLTPLAGERAVPDPRTVVPLPGPCRL